jgi:hypothetical protein
MNLNNIFFSLERLAHWQNLLVCLIMGMIIVIPKLSLALLQDEDVRIYALSFRNFIYSIQLNWISGFKKTIDAAYKNEFGGFIGTVIAGLGELFGSYYGLLTLVPVMIGYSHSIDWLYAFILPFSEPLVFLKIMGAFILLITILSQIPFLNTFIAYPLSVSIVAYFIGITKTLLLPPFLVGAELVIIGVLIQYFLIFSISVIYAFMPSSIVFSPFGKICILLKLFLSPYLNLIPAFLYSSWLATHVH